MKSLTQSSYFKIGFIGFTILFFWLDIFGNPNWGFFEDSQNNSVSPKLSGPQELCIVFGSVIGNFSGGGDPNIDVYYWEILNPQGTLLMEKSGGSQFQKFSYSFQEVGNYTVKLRVRRNADFIHQEQLQVSVKNGPELAVLSDYLICGEDPTIINAINPNSSNFSDFVVNWKNQSGQVIANTNSLSVTEEGFYYFTVTSKLGGCEVNGNTYAGPSLDFSLRVSDQRVCKGSAVTLSTDTPIPGEWYLIKPGNSAREFIGNAFEIVLEKEELQAIGTYQAIFSASSPNYPNCKSTRKINFEIIEAPNIKIELKKRPDNCGLQNGEILIENLVDLDSLVVEELGQKWFNIPAGASQLITNLLPQIYTVVAYTPGCKIVSLYSLVSNGTPINPPAAPPFLPPLITIEPETCGPFGPNPGTLKLEFSGDDISVDYRILAENVGQIQSGNIKDQKELVLEVMGGVYFLELKFDGCSSPIETINIPKKPQVNFSVPSEISICKVFELVPETSEELIFTITFPDLSTQTLDHGQSFTLTDSGDYQILGVPKDPNSDICPTLKTFNASLAKDYTFEAELIQEDCFGNKIYAAKIDGVSEKEVSVRWFNSEGKIVGRGLQYFSGFSGIHSLVVQPLKSGYCPFVPYQFEIEQPIISVEVQFTEQKICPYPGFAELELITNRPEAIEEVRWTYFDDFGNRKDLTEYSGSVTDTGSFIIQASEPGNYEVAVYNRIGCEIGRNFTKLEMSELITEPNLEDSYGVCVKNTVGPILNPGSYIGYRWYFEGNLVSEEPNYMPIEPGNYSLEVRTADGCTFEDYFSTFDLCLFEYQMPNAMIINDPNRKFEVWLSAGIESAELFIINRQGDLIYYREIIGMPESGPAFSWNGHSFGKPSPPGIYAVVLQLSNNSYSFSRKITQSLLVIE